MRERRERGVERLGNGLFLCLDAKIYQHMAYRRPNVNALKILASCVLNAKVLALHEMFQMPFIFATCYCVFLIVEGTIAML